VSFRIWLTGRALAASKKIRNHLSVRLFLTEQKCEYQEASLRVLALTEKEMRQQLTGKSSLRSFTT
jgi:hypothetical protein